MIRAERTSSILMLGPSAKEAKGMVRAIHETLWTTDATWRVTAITVTTIEEALAAVVAHREIELVMPCAGYASLHKKRRLCREMAVLAEDMRGHSHHPWVMLYSDLAYLEPLFRKAGLHTSFSLPETAIRERWEDQARIAA